MTVLTDKKTLTAATVLFITGIVLIPVGFSIWFSLPPPTSDEYAKVDVFLKHMGPSLYLFGFYFLVIAWYYVSDRSYSLLVGFAVTSLVFIVGGIVLDNLYQTYIYEPLMFAGIGLFAGTVYGAISHFSYILKIVKGTKEKA